jgi:hypothetical protein
MVEFSSWRKSMNLLYNGHKPLQKIALSLEGLGISKPGLLLGGLGAGMGGLAGYAGASLFDLSPEARMAAALGGAGLGGFGGLAIGSPKFTSQLAGYGATAGTGMLGGYAKELGEAGPYFAKGMKKAREY